MSGQHHDFGPWAAGIPEGERVARLRALRALAHVLCGGPRQPLVVALRAAERDPVEAERALELLDALSALHRRRLLATYAALATPIAGRRGGCKRGGAMTARVNLHRRLSGETVSLTLEIETGNFDAAGQPIIARHPLNVSLMYDAADVLREVVFVGRGKIGHGLDLLLHDLGIKLSRAIQGRDPDTGAPQGRGSVGDTSPQTGTSP